MRFMASSTSGALPDQGFDIPARLQCLPLRRACVRACNGEGPMDTCISVLGTGTGMPGCHH